jgi:hypothetical protein
LLVLHFGHNCEFLNVFWNNTHPIFAHKTEIII